MDSKVKHAQKPLAWIWKVSGRHKWNVLALTATWVSLSALGVLQAWVLRDLIDRAVDRDQNAFVWYAVYFVGVIVAQLLLRAFVRFMKENTRSALENTFKRRLYESLLYKDYAEVTAVHSEEWMNRLTSDTVVVADGVSNIVPEVTGMVVRLIGALAGVLMLVQGFTWLILPAGLLLGALAYVFRTRLKTLHKRIQEADGRLRVYLGERLTNLMIVRTYAREPAILAGADAAMADHRTARMNRNRFANLCNVGIGLLVHGSYAAAALYCGSGILTGTMSYGTFTAVLQLVGQLQAPFHNLSGYFPQYYAMLASAERLMEAEAFAPDCVGEKQSEQAVRRFYETSFEAIALKDVSFTYRARSDSEFATPRSVVLQGVNICVQKGDAVAITGPSGCGKSTLLKLLMCLYPVNSGERILASKDGEQPLRPEWRGLFAYVPQGNQLMSGTIRSVVSFGNTDIGDDAIRQALSIACADDFVRELPSGLDTVLGEKGAGLSEGQMQRLAIARAILSAHPILLLDEATSSLDENTEIRLLQNLRQLTDRTILFVTHRTQILSICNKEIAMRPDGVQTKELS